MDTTCSTWQCAVTRIHTEKLMLFMLILIVCIKDSAEDNAKFGSCGRDRAVFLWDVPTGNVIRKFEGHDHVYELSKCREKLCVRVI